MMNPHDILNIDHDIYPKKSKQSTFLVYYYLINILEI